MEKKITVCIADDHAILRHGVQALIKQENNIEMIWEAANGHEVLELIQNKSPDVLILDIAMPKLNGIEVTKRVKKISPKTKIIILTMYDTHEYIYELLSCGISGYLLKEAVAKDLISAIRAVYKGDFYLSPSISRQVVNGYLELKQGEEIRLKLVKNNLTEREREILQLIAEGYSSREIASLLKSSIKTIDTHRNNLMKKLDIHRKSELIKYAIREGIIQINAKPKEFMEESPTQ
ncbi:MAG: response regulator transcription factor [bacterium]